MSTARHTALTRQFYAQVCAALGILFSLRFDPLSDPSTRAVIARVCAVAAVVLWNAATPQRVLTCVAALSVVFLPLQPIEWSAIGLLLGLCIRTFRSGRADATLARVLLLSLIALSLRAAEDIATPGAFSHIVGAVLDSFIPRQYHPRTVDGVAFGADIALAVVGYGVAALPFASRQLLLLGPFLCCMIAGRYLESGWVCFVSSSALLSYWITVGPIQVPSDLSRRAIQPLTSFQCLYCVAVALAGFISIGNASHDVRARVGIIASGVANTEFGTPASSLTRPKDSRPRFGRFCRLLERSGLTVKSVVSPAELENNSEYTTLITINLSGPQADAFVPAIRSAVQNGTRLLVLSDHTDLFGQLEPTNALLRDTGIELNFDSIVPIGIGGGWIGAMLTARDPLFGPHQSALGCTWSVGASLNAHPPARTLAVASRAFRDRGNKHKLGGLGNLRRDTSEDVGGMTIAAASRLGLGGVLVFGDTACLQDGSVESGRNFVDGVVAWVGHKIEQVSWFPCSHAGLLCLGFLTLAISLHLTRRLLLPLSLVLLVSTLVGNTIQSGFQRPATISDRAGLLVETGHHPRIAAGGDFARMCPTVFDASEAHGVVGRYGALDELTAADEACVIVEPTKEFSDVEVETLLKYIDEGGRLALFVGPRGAISLRRFLECVGLSIGQPLGTGREDGTWVIPLRGRPLFHGAYELVASEVTQGTPLVAMLGQTCAMRGRRGRGVWLVVSDPQLPWASTTEFRNGGNGIAGETVRLLIDELFEPTLHKP